MVSRQAVRLGQSLVHQLCREYQQAPACFGTLSCAGRSVVFSGVACESPSAFRSLVGSQPALSWPCALQRGLQTSAALQEDVRVQVPSMGDSVSEGTVIEFPKKTGDPVNEDDVLVQIETDKVTIDVRYTESQPGTLKEYLVKADDTVTVGQEVCVVAKGEVSEESQQESKPEKDDEARPEPKKEEPKAKKEEPKAKKEEPQPQKQAGPPKQPPKQEKPKQQAKLQKEGADDPSAAQPAGKPERPERRVKMTRLRARVAERLKGAQNTFAMLTTFNEIDMTNLMSLRADYKDAFLEKHGVKLGFMSAFVKAAADALQQVPATNGVIDGDEIVYRDYIDISIAVATPKGLVVPVLRSADTLSFAEVEKNINALGKKARDGTISIDDMAGGTFTISNGGVYGSLLSTPIINPPQSAILGMHSINQRPAVVNGQIVARPMMNIALTYDHRLVDGREAVTFLKRVKDVIEDPRRLLIDV